MSVLIAPPPWQPQKLSSAEIWSSKFKSKLPNTVAQDQAARTLLLLIRTVVIASPPFSTVRPQFVHLPRHDEAMVQPASSSDYVRQLASFVCVNPITSAHCNRIPPQQQIDRRQHYSIFHCHRKGHGLVQSPLNMMNGVNTLNPLPIPCRSSNESLIVALSVN